MEKALPIKNFQGYYITDKGNVYSRIVKKRYNVKGRIKKLSLWKTKNSYLKANLNGNILRVHRLVAEAFIPNTENKPEVNHINGIKTDNRVENLEWVTKSENAKHSIHILHNNHKCPHGYKSRFTKKQIEQMIIDRKKGINYKEICKKYNISRARLYAITRTKIKGKTRKGSI